ncbi:hypothetical protein HFO61_30450 [Rhizobium leguminosarum]|uniref:hypothetical protein n=1 Tax=Rhizobium leguminosarum TaxID=384 RepID=UPI001C978925|nr:hypothetical protein [Rhizobium leguminosarum]MBY5551067.1 hypothetical protein [Rhizobium leguminosarum]
MTKGIERNGYVLDWIGGSVPVQAEGTIDGRAFYFRARGSQWSLDIGVDANTAFDANPIPLWWHVEPWGEWPDAGYMPEDVALAMIDKAVALYREQQPQEIGSDHPDWQNHVLRAWSDERIGTLPATKLLGIDDAELEKRALERGLPLNGYHELAKASKAHREALAAEMASFNFPADYHERERAILLMWGRGTLSMDQASKFLSAREEDIPARARFLGIPAPNQEGGGNG